MNIRLVFFPLTGVILFAILSCNKSTAKKCDSYGVIILPVNITFWTKLNTGTGISAEVRDAANNFIVSSANNIIKNTSIDAPECINNDANKYARFKARQQFLTK